MKFDLSNLKHYSNSYRLFKFVSKLKGKTYSLAGQPPSRPGRAAGRGVTRAGQPLASLWPAQAGCQAGQQPEQTGLVAGQAGARPSARAVTVTTASDQNDGESETEKGRGRGPRGEGAHPELGEWLGTERGSESPEFDPGGRRSWSGSRGRIRQNRASPARFYR